MKLSATQRRKLLKLLYVKYTVQELSTETDIPIHGIELVCSDGCPHQVDKSETRIVGTDFQEWYAVCVHSSKKCPSARGLINRENFYEVKQFLDYRNKVLQLMP